MQSINLQKAISTLLLALICTAVLITGCSSSQYLPKGNYEVGMHTMEYTELATSSIAISDDTSEGVTNELVAYFKIYEDNISPLTTVSYNPDKYHILDIRDILNDNEVQLRKTDFPDNTKAQIEIYRTNDGYIISGDYDRTDYTADKVMLFVMNYFKDEKDTRKRA